MSVAGSAATSLAQRLQEGAAQAGLDLASPVQEKLLAFLSLISKWNAVYNLTAVRDPEQMLIQHLLDSLAIIVPLSRHIDLSGATIADIGSGAGLPGLPLAIVFPTAKVISIEPVGKKVAFQRQSCAELALANVEVYSGRAQALTRPVDLVICRAFASMVDFVGAAAGLIGPSTLLVAMKGQRAGIESECADLPPHCVAEIEALQVPFLAAQRHLVLIRHAGRSAPQAAAQHAEAPATAMAPASAPAPALASAPASASSSSSSSSSAQAFAPGQTSPGTAPAATPPLGLTRTEPS
jgi:16S rRNA (guanine527-N7)-methyltransferase